MVQLFAFHRGTVLTKLHFGELGHLIVCHEQIHKFAVDDEGELHPGIGTSHVSFDFRPCDLESWALSFGRFLKVLDWKSLHFDCVVAFSVGVSSEAKLEVEL